MATYRVNLHTPRKPSPLNPAVQKLARVETAAAGRPSRKDERDSQREGSRRSRTVSPTQKILRRKAAKTLQTNALRRQVEEYEAKTLQGLAMKSTASKIGPSHNGKGKDSMDSTFKIGITVATSNNHQPSKKKRRRRWGAIWMFLRSRPVVATLGSFWRFESSSTKDLTWHPAEQQNPVVAASAA